MEGCHTLAVIYESMYGKAPMHMTACEEVIGLPGDVSTCIAVLEVSSFGVAIRGSRSRGLVQFLFLKESV